MSIRNTKTMQIKSIIGLFVAAVLYAGCGAPDKGIGSGELVVHLGPNPETMDPALNTGSALHYILYAFDRLLALDKDDRIVPSAAESWEVSEDGLEWTFHLREGLKWSDGSSLTAEDFVYSWRRVADPNTAAPYGETVLGMVAGYREAIGNPDAEGNMTTEPDMTKLGIDAPNPLTFRVRLSTPTPYFDKLAAFEPLSPVQRATVEANGDGWASHPKTYISNGPFYLSEWVEGSYLVLKKNPYYRDQDAVKLDSIKCLLIDDSHAAYAAWQTGEALLVRDLPSEEIPVLKNEAGFRSFARASTNYDLINMRRPAFADARVRRALSLAVDRAHLSEIVLSGLAWPATNLIGYGVSDWDGSGFKENANGGRPYIDADAYEENLACAKELMAEAGYPGGTGFPVISYATIPSSENRGIAEYLQQAWKELGITVNVEIMEWAGFIARRRAGDYDIAAGGWVFDYDDPSNMLELFYSTNGNNDSGYRSPAFDSLMDRSRSELDSRTRFGLLHEAEDLLMWDTVVIPLLWEPVNYLISDKITGWWQVSAAGRFYLQYADIKE